MLAMKTLDDTIRLDFEAAGLNTSLARRRSLRLLLQALALPSRLAVCNEFTYRG